MHHRVTRTARARRRSGGQKRPSGAFLERGRVPDGAPKIALRYRKAIFIMIAALCECFHLPLTSVQVSGSFYFLREIQELLV